MRWGPQPTVKRVTETLEDLEDGVRICLRMRGGGAALATRDFRAEDGGGQRSIVQ